MDEDKPSPFADLVTGVAWLAVATAIMIGAWRMDRLQHLSVQIYTAPGLVPGLLGAAIALMALLLIARALRAGAIGQAAIPPIHITEHWRLIAALALGLGFAVGLVGHGVRFWIAAALYVALMVAIFEFPDRRRDGQVLRGAVVAVLFGVASGLGIHFLFQDLFLVRLP